MSFLVSLRREIDIYQKYFAWNFIFEGVFFSYNTTLTCYTPWFDCSKSKLKLARLFPFYRWCATFGANAFWCFDVFTLLSFGWVIGEDSTTTESDHNTLPQIVIKLYDMETVYGLCWACTGKLWSRFYATSPLVSNSHRGLEVQVS